MRARGLALGGGGRERREQRRRDVRRRLRIAEAGVPAGDLGQGAAIAGRHRRAAGHGLEQGQAEALGEAGQAEGRRVRVERAQDGVRHHAQAEQAGTEGPPGRVGEQLRSAMPLAAHHGQPAVGECGFGEERAQQAEQVLAPIDGPHEEQVGTPVRQPVARQHGLPRRRRGPREGRAHPFVHDDDALGRAIHALEEVAPRGLAHGDDAGAARGQRPVGGDLARAEGGGRPLVREQGEDVVQRGHAGHAAPGGHAQVRAVHQRGARPEQGQGLLVPEARHPDETAPALPPAGEPIGELKLVWRLLACGERQQGLPQLPRVAGHPAGPRRAEGTRFDGDGKQGRAGAGHGAV